MYRPIRQTFAVVSALLAAPCLLAPATQAGAQPVSEFRLPPGTPTPTPRPAGPIDPERPAALPEAPAPSASASPSPALTTPPPAAPPAPRRQPPALATPVPPAAAPKPSPTEATSTPAPAASPPAEPAAIAPAAGPLPAPVQTAAEPAPPAIAAASIAMAWWWLVPAALAGAIATWLLLRRRESKPAIQADSPPAAAPSPSPELPPPAAEPEALTLALEPVRLSITLINAALQYRVTLANRTAAPFRQVALALDMIGAHASLSDDSQLARDGAALELRHELFDLAPDEVVDLVGEMRLPLTEVQAIRAGDALLFVPLVRLRADFDGQTLTRVAVFGEAPEVPAGPLRPFRLDLGPRLFDNLATRDLGA